MEKLCPLVPMHTLSHAAFNSIVSSEQKRDEQKNYGLTKETRATVDQVLDPRTLRTLSKLQKQRWFESLHGAISTGKEANVYLASSCSSLAPDLAVKVYKTSILVFKDRSRYVEGEFRFRGGCHKGNPRKMVALWAEKELRNLRRLRDAGLACPQVLVGRENVIVMKLVTACPGSAAEAEDAVLLAASPQLLPAEEPVVACKLKDADVSEVPGGWSALYEETCIIMRKMFQQCQLVHGDLSEYNLLFDGQRVVVIDVSQSVEHEHPYALDFLKRDCVNVNAFFRKQPGVHAALTAEALFEWLVSPAAAAAAAGDAAGDADEAERASFRAALARAAAAAEEEGESGDEELFLNTFTPTSLYQVGDLAKLEETIDKRGRGEKTAVDRLLGGLAAAHASDCGSDEEDGSEDGSDACSDAGSEVEGDSDSASSAESWRPGMIPAGMSKAEWKKQVKEAKREQRKSKIPKKDKKREQKKHSFRKQ